MDTLSKILRFFGKHDLLPPRLHHKLCSVLRGHRKLPGKDFNVSFFGYRYAGCTDDWMDWHAYYHGAYNKGTIFLLKDIAVHLNSNSIVFVDVGAAVGQMSLFMATYCENVYAFEPSPDCVRILERRMHDNGVTNVVCRQIGLGDEEQRLPLYEHAESNLDTSSFLPNFNAAEASSPVPVMRGDDALRESGASRVDIVKIDAQGFEAKVLRGLSQTINRDEPIVVLDVPLPARSDLGSMDYLERLFFDKYDFFKVLNVMGKRYRLSGYNLDLDHSAPVCLCVPKSNEKIRTLL